MTLGVSLEAVTLEAPIRRPSHKASPYASARGFTIMGDGEAVGYESGLEERFLEACRVERRIHEVTAQPFTLAYKVRGGPLRRYTPDYLVYLKGGTGLTFPGLADVEQLLVEVKPWRVLKREYASRRHAYHAAWMWALAAPTRAFVIVTDRQLSVPFCQNVLLLSPYLQATMELEKRLRIIDHLRRHLEARIGSIIDSCSTNTDDVWATQRALFRMMLDQEIRVSMTVPITKRTVVRLGHFASGF